MAEEEAGLLDPRHDWERLKKDNPDARIVGRKAHETELIASDPERVPPLVRRVVGKAVAAEHPEKQPRRRGEDDDMKLAYNYGATG